MRPPPLPSPTWGGGGRIKIVFVQLGLLIEKTEKLSVKFQGAANQKLHQGIGYVEIKPIKTLPRSRSKNIHHRFYHFPVFYNFFTGAQTDKHGFPVRIAPFCIFFVVLKNAG